MNAGPSRDLVELAVVSLEYALRRLRNRREAEEVAQSAVAAYMAHCRRRQGKPIDNPEAYITRITANLIIELLQDRATRQQLGDLDALDDDAVPRESPINRALVAVFLDEQLRSTLTERERQVLLCRYEADMSRAQIAQYLGIEVETVKDHLRQAKRKLRDQLPPDALEGLHDE